MWIHLKTDLKISHKTLQSVQEKLKTSFGPAVHPMISAQPNFASPSKITSLLPKTHSLT